MKDLVIGKNYDLRNGTTTEFVGTAKSLLFGEMLIFKPIKDPNNYLLYDEEDEEVDPNCKAGCFGLPKNLLKMGWPVEIKNN